MPAGVCLAPLMFATDQVGRSVKFLLGLASTVILGLESRRDSRPHFSSQDFQVLWNGTFSSTTGGVWLLLITFLLQGVTREGTHSLTGSLLYTHTPVRPSLGRSVKLLLAFVSTVIPGFSLFEIHDKGFYKMSGFNALIPLKSNVCSVFLTVAIL
jgi:hypothetical protein